MNKIEIRDDEYLESMPKLHLEQSNLRLTKTKAIIKDQYDPDDSTLEIFRKNNVLEIRYTNHQEYTKEEFKECDLGHKHRVIARKDLMFDLIILDKKQMLRLKNWFLEQEQDED